MVKRYGLREVTMRWPGIDSDALTVMNGMYHLKKWQVEPLNSAPLATQQASHELSKLHMVWIGEALASIVEEDTRGSEECLILIASSALVVEVVLMYARNGPLACIMT